MNDVNSNAQNTYPIDRATSTIWWAVTVGVIAFIVVVLSEITVRQPMKISPDPAFFVAIGQLILQGKVPYVDLFDVNPPLVFYIHTIPALVARCFPVPVSESFTFFVIACFALSVVISAVILWRRRHHSESFLFCPLLIGFSLATFMFGTRLNDFGQREHLFVLSLLPFFLIRWLRWTARPVSRIESVVASITLAVTSLLKPHFIFVVLFTELSMFLQNVCSKGKVPIPFRTPETLIIAVTSLAYALYFCVMPSQARQGYFDFIIPAYSLGYDAFTSSTPTLLAGALLQFKYSVYVCVLSLVGAHVLSGRSTLLMPLAGLTTAGYIIYLWQGNAWINRAMPFFIGGYMLASIEIAIVLYAIGSLAKNASRIAHRCIATAIGLLLACAIGYERWIQMLISDDPQPFQLSRIGLKGACAHFGLKSVAETILQETTDSDTILFISPYIDPGYPTLLQLNRRPASRYLHGMLIPVLLFGAKSADDTKKVFAQQMMEKVTNDYCEDIKQNRPKLIFVQKKMLGPFVHNNEKLQQSLSAYEKTSEVEGHDVYRLR